MAEALYRKYRPQVFGDVVGQEHIERTIRNAIEQDKVSHAYLFCGPRGTGKTTTARLLAKALLCEKGPTAQPDGTCPECQAIAAGEHPDVYELDAASRTGVDNVREEIIGRVQFSPTRGSKKIYIIDEVHMLSTAAFNALLKTLEEPPGHVVFILCTTDPQKVPETIHSRCQRFDFRRISAEAMVARLGAICVSEGVEFEGDALELIAHRAEGGMRNALTALEQAITYGAGKVTLATVESLVGSLDTTDLAEVMSAIGSRDVAACFNWVAKYVETGADLAQFSRDLAEHVRNMYVMSLVGADAPLEISEASRREMASQLPQFGPDRLSRMLGVLGDVIAELKTSTNPRLSFEIALTRMVRPESDLTLASLAERIESLEMRLAGSGFASVPAAAAAGAMPVQDASVRPVVPAQMSSVQTQGQMASGPAQMPASSQAPAASFERPAAHSHAQADPSVASGGSAQAQAQPMQRESLGASRGSDVVSSHGEEAPAAHSATGGAQPATGDIAEKLANPAMLQRVWQSVCAAIKRDKPAYAVLFMGTRAVFDAKSGSFTVEFPAENKFAYKAVQKPETVDYVGTLIAQVVGRPIPYSFTQASEGGFPSGGAQPQQQAQPQQVQRQQMQPQPQAAQVQRSQQQAQAAQVQQVRRPVQEQAVQSRPASQPQPQPAPDPVPYDEVPLDVYDQVPVDVYDEVPVEAYGDPAPAMPPEPPDTVSQATTQLAPDGSIVPPRRDSGEQSLGDAVDLQSMLSSTFGGPVKVEEV